MEPLPTLPRRSWLERSSGALAGALILVGAFSLAGWWLHEDSLLQPFSLTNFAAIKANTALCFFLLGLVLLAIELGWCRLAWFALGPVAIGALTLLENILNRDWGIDELLARDHLLI